MPHADEAARERAIWENAVQPRLEVIVDTLSLPYSEVEQVMAHDDLEVRLFALIEFAKRHGQSLDWIMMGNVQSMLLKLKLNNVH